MNDDYNAVCPLYAEDPFMLDIDNMVYAFDSSPPGCFECFIGGIDILSRTDKTVTIEMNHMIRGIEEVGKGCVK